MRRGYWMNGITYDRPDAGKKPLTGDDALFLSNLKDDPGEIRNLRHQHPELVDELSSLAKKWRMDVKPLSITREFQ